MPARPATTDLVAPLEPGWRRALAPELASPEFAALGAFLSAEIADDAVIYPPHPLRMTAFERTPFDQVRVVVLGQDPYHGPEQANGLAFAVPRGVVIPPSLRNVFTELERDLGLARPAHGDLSAWADRGVLLLNTSLTVRAGEAGSHSAAGWRTLTDAAVRALSQQREGIVFLLWGKHAQARADLIDESRHLVLRAAHPSPLSASRGFHGCGHFSRVNEWLIARGEPPIDWSLPA